MVLSLDHPWAFAFGLLGNLISFMVYLAPIPTFYRICRKKSTEVFQSEPYIVALFSSMLWIYYAIVKTDQHLLITINSFGCVAETAYIVMFIFYAPKKVKIHAAKVMVALNVVLFCLIVLSTMLIWRGPARVTALGWMCVGFAVVVFAAPMTIIKQVIRTKSVEFMPFSLSFFLTLSAIVWFSYGLFIKDIYIAIPNILGFGFGVIQMVLYMVYRKTKVEVLRKVDTLPEEHVVKVHEDTLPEEHVVKVHEVRVAPVVSEEEEVEERAAEGTDQASPV